MTVSNFDCRMRLTWAAGHPSQQTICTVDSVHIDRGVAQLGLLFEISGQKGQMEGILNLPEDYMDRTRLKDTAVLILAGSGMGGELRSRINQDMAVALAARNHAVIRFACKAVQYSERDEIASHVLACVGACPYLSYEEDDAAPQPTRGRSWVLLLHGPGAGLAPILLPAQRLVKLAGAVMTCPLTTGAGGKAADWQVGQPGQDRAYGQPVAGPGPASEASSGLQLASYGCPVVVVVGEKDEVSDFAALRNDMAAAAGKVSIRFHVAEGLDNTLKVPKGSRSAGGYAGVVSAVTSFVRLLQGEASPEAGEAEAGGAAPAGPLELPQALVWLDGAVRERELRAERQAQEAERLAAERKAKAAKKQQQKREEAAAADGDGPGGGGGAPASKRARKPSAKIQAADVEGADELYTPTSEKPRGRGRGGGRGRGRGAASAAYAQQQQQQQQQWAGAAYATAGLTWDSAMTNYMQQAAAQAAQAQLASVMASTTAEALEASARASGMSQDQYIQALQAHFYNQALAQAQAQLASGGFAAAAAAAQAAPQQ